MPIHIDKNAETPIHHQLREQIIFLISTGELAIGSLMPSGHELDRRLGIHRNTVYHVYSELEREGWLVKRTGSQFAVVQSIETAKEPDESHDLDGLIDRTIQLAQERGYTLQQLAHRVRRRLMAAPPDHFLMVEPEAGMAEVMKAEILEAIGQPPVSCSLPSFLQDPSQAIGAILLSPAYLIDRVESVPAKYRTTIVPLGYSEMDTYVQMIAQLKEPSVIGLVSVSMAGLKTSTGMLAPALGTLHSLCAYFMETTRGRTGQTRNQFFRYTVKEHPTTTPVRKQSARADLRPAHTVATVAKVSRNDGTGELPLASASDLRAADLLLCDSVTYSAVAHPNRVRYRLLSEESLRRIATAAKSLKPR